MSRRGRRSDGGLKGVMCVRLRISSDDEAMAFGGLRMMHSLFAWRLDSMATLSLTVRRIELHSSDRRSN